MNIISQLDALGYSERGHACGAFSSRTLGKIEALLPPTIERSCETGCGKTTILFSNISNDHTVFSLDDTTDMERSSVNYYRNCPATRMDRVTEVFGPTQVTLPHYRHRGPYDLVLIDGPHGYPFPELEYYYLYPDLQTGGILIVDDINIPTVGKMAEFIREDEMFSFIDLVDYTAIFRRTDAPIFDTKGDGWWTQRYNRRRVSVKHEAHLADRGAVYGWALARIMHHGRRFRTYFARSRATTPTS